MEKRNICLPITHIRSHVNFGNNLREAKAKKVRFYFVTLRNGIGRLVTSTGQF